MGFESLGCKMYGYTPQEGYNHEESKAIRGDKFCGLLLDAVNQEDLTEGRVESWVSQLKQEGFLEGESSTSSAVTVPDFTEESVVSVSASVSHTPESNNDIARIVAELEKLEKENAKLRQMLEESSSLQEEN